MLNYIAIPYLVIFFVIFILCFPITKNNRNSIVICYNLFLQKNFLLFLLILFIGFRGFIFNDWINYYSFYNSLPSFFDGFVYVKDCVKAASWEKGFVLYAILCKTISSNYFFFQIISSSIDILILFYFFKLYIFKHIIMGFLFFFIFYGVEIEANLLRNSKSIMLFLISIKYIGRKNIIQYMGLNIIGALFHTSSLIYLPLYFVLNKCWPRIVILFVYFVGNIIFLLSFDWILGLLSTISKFNGLRILALLRIYTNPEKLGQYGFSIGYFERQLTFFLIFLLYNKLIKENRMNIIFVNIMYVYLFLYLYCYEVFNIVKRIPLLFICSYWILYPQIYKILSKERKTVFLISILIYGSLRIMQGYTLVHSYENVLLNHSSFNERQMFFKK